MDSKRLLLAFAPDNSLFCFTGKYFPVKQKRSARMRTATYNVNVASDRRRLENVPRHILCSRWHLGENLFQTGSEALPNANCSNF